MRNTGKKRAVYIAKARVQSENIHLSPLKANLAIWNLDRIAPPPLIELSAPSTSPVANAMTAPIAITSGPPAFLSDGRRALIGYADGAIRLWDIPTGQLILSFPAHRGPVRSVAASTGGTFAISGGDDGEVKLWDLPSGNPKGQLRNPAAPLKGWVTHVAISPDGRHALSISGASAELITSPTYNDTLTLWDLATSPPRLTSNSAAGILDNKGLVTQAAFSPDSSELVAAGRRSRGMGDQRGQADQRLAGKRNRRRVFAGRALDRGGVVQWIGENSRSCNANADDVQASRRTRDRHRRDIVRSRVRSHHHRQ